MNTGKKIGFLGGGAMAEAFATGIINSGLVPPEMLYVSDVNRERLTHLQEKLNINVLQNNRELLQSVDIVILAVKPYVLPEVLGELSSEFHTGQLVVSIAAGVSTGYIESFTGEVPVVRVMPNTPCLLGEGAAAVAGGKFASQEDVDLVNEISSSLGLVVCVPEKQIDAVTGVSGSGPAYMYMVMEAMADAGVRMGLSRDTALKLGAQTMLGAAKMVLESGEHPAQLKDKVTTPGGTTIEGIYALENAGVRAAFMEAVEASCMRSKEMQSKSE